MVSNFDQSVERKQWRSSSTFNLSTVCLPSMCFTQDLKYQLFYALLPQADYGRMRTLSVLSSTNRFITESITGHRQTSVPVGLVRDFVAIMKIAWEE